MGKPSLLLAKNLQRIMTRFGISQTELARRCGIAQTTLSVYINGGREPKMDVLEPLATALKCSIADLLEDEPDAKELEIRDQPIMRPFAAIYEAVRQAEQMARNSLVELEHAGMREKIAQQNLDRLKQATSAIPTELMTAFQTARPEQRQRMTEAALAACGLTEDSLGRNAALIDAALADAQELTAALEELQSGPLAPSKRRK